MRKKEMIVLMLTLLCCCQAFAQVRVNSTSRQRVQRTFPKERHCGCAGYVTMVNSTADTLDVYMKYLKPADVPTIPNTAMRSILSERLMADFYILPNDSTTFRGSCTGGIQVEADIHNNRFFESKKFKDVNEGIQFVRMSCMNKTLVFSSE